MAPPISGSAPRKVTLPTAREAAESYAAKKEAEANTSPRPPTDSFQDAPKSTQGIVARTGIKNVEGKLTPETSWMDLPKDLKTKMEPEVWNSLETGQKSTLIASYHEFKKAEIWDQVTQVVGEKEKREPKVGLPGGYETRVNGNSGAVQFKVRDADRFRDSLVDNNPNFGVDGSFMAKMHPGQTSIRESTQPKPIHISIGPGNYMDAHFDQVNPVKTPKNGETQMDLKRGVKHWREELLPELIRKKTGIPGVNIKPELTPGGRGEPGAGGPDWSPNGRTGTDLRGTINLEFHGVEKKKPAKLQTHTNGEYKVPADAVKAYEAKLDGMTFKFPEPLEVDVKAMAKDIATQLAGAGSRKDNTVRIDLPDLAFQKGKQGPAITEVHRIADAVKKELIAAGVDVSDVNRLTVTFGKTDARNKYATEGMTVEL